MEKVILSEGATYEKVWSQESVGCSRKRSRVWLGMKAREGSAADEAWKEADVKSEPALYARGWSVEFS